MSANDLIKDIIKETGQKARDLYNLFPKECKDMTYEDVHRSIVHKTLTDTLTCLRNDSAEYQLLQSFLLSL